MTMTNTAQKPPQKDGSYYFDDGDCVLQVDGHLFQVHKFLLKRNSAFFRDMFNTKPESGLGMAATGIIEGSSDDHPIICQESFEAFHALCWLIPGDIRFAQRTISTGNINELVLIASLTHKYRFEEFEEWAFDVLEDLSQDSSALSTVSDMHRIEDLLFIMIQCERHILAGHKPVSFRLLRSRL
ncbi:hypothetical protein P691DRAFT_768030 [Macrolepiota fuliginosa MF-IS2]|uniref:BTB domain-containing protein n=1 Tax=Macrolepiota fuliginosa MF-IS2 TaxID=1400762 RepID=A0A9P6BV40_9AGAR|nr:hypothetical protein P691DRAFT_768030 [Macrolepiota fuliginosa MF-IS2]